MYDLYALPDYLSEEQISSLQEYTATAQELVQFASMLRDSGYVENDFFTNAAPYKNRQPVIPRSESDSL